MTASDITRPAPAAKNSFQRIAGVFFAPVETFADIARKPDVLILHPGPINRGVELASDVADGPNSSILRQVSNGLAIRMAVLFLLNQTSETPA